MSEVIKRFDRSPARFKWLVIDACRNDPFSRSAEIPGSRSIQRLDDPPRGSAVMLSCAPGEKSYEDKEFEHGLFTYSFVDGLKGAADADNDGSLTLYELAKYTKEKTESWAEDKFNQPQRPYLKGENSDFIIVDGLLRNGLSRDVWTEAEACFGRARQYRRERRYEEAKREIDRALDLTSKADPPTCSDRQKYLDEADVIDGFQAKSEAERRAALAEEARQRAEAEAEAARRAAEEARRRGGGSSSSGSLPPDPVVSTEPSEESDTFVPPPPPAVRVSSLGVGTEAGEKKTLPANGVDFTFCWCPAGGFDMGSPESEKGRFDNEDRHHVRLTKGFWLLESELTQEQWRAVWGTSKDGDLRETIGKGSRYPMYFVNWDESVEFCRKLSTLTGERVQLPTESQWEYACRAGSDGPYAGTGELDEMGWYDGNSGKAHEVKRKKPNAWGL